MPMQWLASKVPAAAAAAPRPPLQQQQQQQQGLNNAAVSSSSSTCSPCSCSSNAHRHAGAVRTSSSSTGSSSLQTRTTTTTAAAAAAAGAYPLPDPYGDAHNASSMAPASSSSSSYMAAASPSAASAAAVDALTGVPMQQQGWQLSNRIRHSVEEAMKVGMGNMGFMHLPTTTTPQHSCGGGSVGEHQQQHHHQHQHEHEQQHKQEQEQQHHATWQQLIQDLEEVEAQHSTAAGAAAAVAAVAATTDAADVDNSSSSSSSSPTLLSKSTAQIQACRSAAQLEQLLQGNWQEMDHVHISASFVRLAHMQQQQQHAASKRRGVVDAGTTAAGPRQQQQQQLLSEPAWLLLQQAALQQLHKLQARQCSNILWACASLGVEPMEPLLQGLVARSGALLQQGLSTTPQGFANTIWGLATLKVSPSSEWMMDFFRASQQQLCNFQPQELSTTIWALAQLRQQPPADWFEAYLAASAAKLGACNAQALCNQLWGLARLGRCVPEQWWAAATYACSVRAAELSPAGLAQVLWAAGIMAGKQQRYQQQQQWQEPHPHLQQQEQEQEQQQNLQQQTVSSPQRKSKWGYINAQTGSGISAGVANSSSSSSTQWLQPLLAALQPQLQQVHGSALCSLLWSLAVLGHHPGPDFVQSWISRVAAAGPLQASSAVHALWAASNFAGAGLELQQLHPLFMQLQEQRLQGCMPHELVYVAAAVANLSKKQQQQQSVAVARVDDVAEVQQHAGCGLPPLPSGVAGGAAFDGPSSLAHLSQQLLSASHQQLQHFQLGQLCQFGRWLAAAGIRPDAVWVDAFLAATAPHLHTLQPGQQLQLLQAVMHWGIGSQPGWSALFLSSCASPAALPSYTAGHVGALLQGFAAAGLQPQPQHLQLLLHRVLQRDAKLDAAAVAGVLSGLYSLGFRPPDGWVHQFWGSAAAAVMRASADGVAAVAEVLQQPSMWHLSLRPNRPFVSAYHAAIAAALPQLQPVQAAAVLASLTAARIRPKQQQEHLLPALMAVAVKGLYTMPLQHVISAWWGLVRPKVLRATVPLEQLQTGAGAAAVAEQPKQVQDEQWLQQQWQSLWMKRLISDSRSNSNSSSAGQLAGMKLVSLLQVADCLRRLQQPMPGSWADTYISVVSAHIPHMAAHELHLLLHALPCLQAAAGLPEFSDRLMAAAAPLLGDFTPTQLSDSLHSIQQAGLKPPEPWLKQFISAAAACLPQFWPRQLTQVLTALARLRYMPDAAFLSAATEAAVEHLPKYKVAPAEMVDLLWALVALRVRPSAAWMAKYEARLLERGPGQLDGQQLSRLGWCMSALQRTPGRVLWAKWLAATQQQMHAMDSNSLADTLWTCAMLDEQPSRAWLDSFIACSNQHLTACCTSSLASLVWSLALLQHRPPSDWMQACLSALSERMDTAACADPLAAGQVSRVAWALAALDCQLPAAFSAQLLQLCLQQVGQLDADSLAQLVWAWDRLDDTQGKQYVRQIAAAARSQLLPHGFDSLAGPAFSSTTSSSKISFVGARVGRSGGGPAGAGAGAGAAGDAVLPLPSGRVRLGQQRVLLKPGGGNNGSRALVVAQQQVVAAGSKSLPDGVTLSAAQGLLVAQRGVFAAGKVKLGTKQQLMATLQKMYAADSASSSSSSNSSSASEAHAEMSMS